MYGVLAPIAYAAFLVGSLLIFSKVYRKRQAKRAQREPWFGPHHSRDIYVSLLSMDPPPPRNVLVSALIRRAVTDIQRVMEIRENKAALQNLLSKGQIGDDTWNHLLETEKEMDSELYEVVQEANHFRPGWGQYIFPHAGDMIQHEKNKKIFETIEQERKKMADRYGSNASPIHPTPILGLVGGKRSLPSTTPSNAQLPGSGTPSKPGTPAPASALTPEQQAQQQAQVQAAMQQRAILQQAQQQHALNMQRQAQQQQQGQTPAQSSTLSPQSTPSKSAAQSKNNSPSKGAVTTPSGSPNGKSKGSTNGSGSTTPNPNPTMMLRQPSTTSTVESDAEDDIEDGEGEGDEVASSGVGSPPTTGTKKTPKKKNKKKGKKK